MNSLAAEVSQVSCAVAIFTLRVALQIVYCSGECQMYNFKVFLTSPEPSKNCYNFLILQPILKTLTPL